MSAFLSGNPLQGSGLYEEEEHPWGAPPPSTSLHPSATSNDASSSQTGFGDRESGFADNGFGSNNDAGFASDPYVASPFARQPSYTGSVDRSFSGGPSRGSRNLFGEDDRSGRGALEGLNNTDPSGDSFPSTADVPPPAPEKPARGVQPSPAFASKTFQSHNPSSLMPSHPALMSNNAQGSGPQHAPQLTPGYPMPQSYSTPTAAYSPFARVDSLNTRKESVEEMYGVPENFLEVEVRNAMTHG
jgi:hypothetical protein